MCQETGHKGFGRVKASFYLTILVLGGGQRCQETGHKGFGRVKASFGLTMLVQV